MVIGDQCCAHSELRPARQPTNRPTVDPVHNEGMQTIERTFFCPDLDSQAAALQIRETLDNAPGVLETEVSLTNRTVRVVLGDPDGETTVRRHLSSAGFPPED